MSDSKKPKASKPVRREWGGWQWTALALTLLMACTVGGTALVMAVTVDTTLPPQIVSAPPPSPFAFNGFAVPDPEFARPEWAKGDAELTAECQRFFARFGDEVRSPTGNPLSFFDFHELTPPDPDSHLFGPGGGPAAFGPGENGVEDEFDPERFAKSVIRSERMIWRGWDWKQATVRVVKSLPDADRYEAVVWHPAKDGTRVKIRWSLMRFGDHLAIVGWENLHTGVTAWDLVSAAAGPPWARRNHDRRRFREVLLVHRHLDADRTEMARKVVENLQRVRFPKELEYPLELAEARLALKEGDREEVKTICESLVQRDPTRLAAYPMLAAVCLDDEEYERVKEVCTSYMSVVGDDSDVLALRAEAHYRLVETDEATADFEAALKLDPYQPLALSWKRRALLADKKGDVAHWLAAAPNPSRLFDPLADAAERDEDWPAVVALAQKFRDLRPADSRGAAKLIAVRCREKKFDDAVTVFREAIPKLIGPERIKLGDTFYYQMLLTGEMNRVYDALPDDLARNNFRQLANYFYHQIDRLSRNGEKQPDDSADRIAAARKLIDQHHKRFPDDLWLSFSEGRLKAREKDYAAAAKHYSAAIAKIPHTGDEEKDAESGYDEVRYEHVECLYELKRGTEAIRQYAPAVEVFEQLAWSYSTDKDAAGLANLIAEWAKLAPKPAAVAFWKGELHWLKKEYKAAAIAFREHIDREEDSPHGQYWVTRDRLIRSLVRDKNVRAAEAELAAWEHPPPDIRALVLVVSGDEAAAEVILREYVNRGVGYQDSLYRDDDLGPILRGEAFRQFRKDFPPPCLNTIEPKK
jgi:tetratricopeptide (TPR) repeat protein